MDCEMCGKEGKLFRAKIEGITLNVCKPCGKYGKILGSVHRPSQKKQKIKKETSPEKEQEVEEIIVEDYASQVRQAREKKGWTQKEAAQRLQEKESLLQKIENSQFEPSMKLAKKLETMLNVKLITSMNVKPHQKKDTSSSDTMTIGDVIKIRKRKR